VKLTVRKPLPSQATRVIPLLPQSCRIHFRSHAAQQSASMEGYTRTADSWPDEYWCDVRDGTAGVGILARYQLRRSTHGSLTSRAPAAIALCGSIGLPNPMAKPISRTQRFTKPYSLRKKADGLGPIEINGRREETNNGGPGEMSRSKHGPARLLRSVQHPPWWSRRVCAGRIRHLTDRRDRDWVERQAQGRRDSSWRRWRPESGNALPMA